MNDQASLEIFLELGFPIRARYNRFLVAQKVEKVRACLCWVTTINLDDMAY